MHRWLPGALLLVTAGAAQATPFVLVFDGDVTFLNGSGPSLDGLGLSIGSPLHYEVLVDRDGEAFIVDGAGQVSPRPDVFNAPDDHRDNFYAELVFQPYETPGSYFDFGRVFYNGVDVVSPSFPDCPVLGRLFVGTELFHIDGCAPVADWDVGFEVGSQYVWTDTVSGEFITLRSRLAVTDVVNVPEPGSGSLLMLGIASLVARHRTRGRPPADGGHATLARQRKRALPSVAASRARLR